MDCCFAFHLTSASNLSGILANIDQKPERITKAIYGIRTIDSHIELYRWISFKTFQVLEDLAGETRSYLNCGNTLIITLPVLAGKAGTRKPKKSGANEVRFEGRLPGRAGRIQFELVCYLR